MQNKKNNLLAEIAGYYTSKLSQHGETPQGVDWNGEESQTQRFRQLCKIIDPSKKDFSINDLGCGYGALYDFLALHYEAFSYSGVDVSASMVRAAEQRHQNKTNARFLLTSEPDQIADYGVASGIFNVRLSHSETEWVKYIETILDALDRTSRMGFSFNCLTLYSDVEKRRDHLYYADPGILFDFCKRRYSRHVALLHDYGLFEFTILVRKQL
ncbi:MAG TPA: class I SAM-dependent methyltransferase [Pseudobdellovibrionaceae bacterium]